MSFRVDLKLHESQVLLKSLDIVTERSFYQMVMHELSGQLYLMAAQYLYLTGKSKESREILSQEVMLLKYIVFVITMDQPNKCSLLFVCLFVFCYFLFLRRS